MPEMTEVVSLVVQTGALGLLTYIVVKGIPAILTIMSLFLKSQAHNDETLSKVGRAVIHLSYKIKNPCIVNDEELTELEKEITAHMTEMTEAAKVDLLEEIRKRGKAK